MLGIQIQGHGPNLLRLGINTITTQSLIKKIQNSRKYKILQRIWHYTKSNSMLGLNRHHMIIIKTRQWNIITTQSLIKIQKKE